MDNLDKKTLTPSPETPLVYLLFIGGAADKNAFLWGDLDQRFVEGFPHKTVYRLANSFNYRLLQRLSKIMSVSANTINQYYRFDYLGYDEIFYPEIKNYDPNALTKADITSSKFTQLCQHIDINSHIYIIGHSLGAWNGSHLSHILSNYGYTTDLLITLDPVGAGNHDLTWAAPLMKQAQIYTQYPNPKAKQWINIRGFEVSLSAKNYSDKFEDWVAWAGGQWLINSQDFKEVLIANELTDIPHKQAENMFNYATCLNISAAEKLEQLIIGQICNH